MYHIQLSIVLYVCVILVHVLYTIQESPCAFMILIGHLMGLYDHCMIISVLCLTTCLDCEKTHILSSVVVRSDYSGLYLLVQDQDVYWHYISNAVCFNPFDVLWLPGGKEGGSGMWKLRQLEVVLLQHSPHDSRAIPWGKPSSRPESLFVSWCILFLEPGHVPTPTIRKPL